MALINVGIDFAGAKEASDARMKPADPGVYNLRVVEVLENDANGNPLKSKKGNPQFIPVCEIFNSSNPAFNGKKIRQFITVPTGGDLSSVGFLVDFASACNRPWSGGSFDPQDFLNAEFVANVSVSEDGKWNNIVSYVK